MTTRTVYPHLFGSTDIYAGFELMPEKMHGWNNHSEHFAELAANARLIVEVGSWLGRSAIALCNAAPNAEVVCIDTWLGSAEMWEKHDDPERYQQLNLVNGYPSIYRQFLSNIVHAGKQEQITPMPLPSLMALRLLAKWDVRPDFIYLDGSHSYEDVVSDIENARELHPRVLAGDDHGLWSGVTRAVEDCFAGRQHVSVDGAFWLVKNNRK